MMRLPPIIIFGGVESAVDVGGFWSETHMSSFGWYYRPITSTYYNPLCPDWTVLYLHLRIYSVYALHNTWLDCSRLWSHQLKWYSLLSKSIEYQNLSIHIDLVLGHNLFLGRLSTFGCRWCFYDSLFSGTIIEGIYVWFYDGMWPVLHHMHISSAFWIILHWWKLLNPNMKSSLIFFIQIIIFRGSA